MGNPFLDSFTNSEVVTITYTKNINESVSVVEFTDIGAETNELLLREDGFFILREDDFFINREGTGLDTLLDEFLAADTPSIQFNKAILDISNPIDAIVSMGGGTSTTLDTSTVSESITFTPNNVYVENTLTIESVSRLITKIITESVATGDSFSANDFMLREDGFSMLREDDSNILREGA